MGRRVGLWGRSNTRRTCLSAGRWRGWRGGWCGCWRVRLRIRIVRSCGWSCSGERSARASWRGGTRPGGRFCLGACLACLRRRRASGRMRRRLSYGELDRRSNQLAHHLRGLGVGPETVVGLCLERSLELIVGLLGILKAGRAYLPLDPQYPAQRLAFMLGDAGACVLVTQAALLDRLALANASSRAAVVQLDADAAAIAAQPTR